MLHVRVDWLALLRSSSSFGLSLLHLVFLFPRCLPLCLKVVFLLRFDCFLLSLFLRVATDGYFTALCLLAYVLISLCGCQWLRSFLFLFPHVSLWFLHILSALLYCHRLSGPHFNTHPLCCNPPSVLLFPHSLVLASAFFSFLLESPVLSLPQLLFKGAPSGAWRCRSAHPLQVRIVFQRIPAKPRLTLVNSNGVVSTGDGNANNPLLR